MENLFEKGNEVQTKNYGIRKIHEAGIVGKGEADKGKLFISFIDDTGTIAYEDQSDCSPVKKGMDIYFAVFNCHINHAKERAIADTINKFGASEYDNQLKAVVGDGIMAIFQKEPTELVRYFAEQIQKYVNEEPTTNEEATSAEIVLPTDEEIEALKPYKHFPDENYYLGYMNGMKEGAKWCRNKVQNQLSNKK